MLVLYAAYVKDESEAIDLVKNEAGALDGDEVGKPFPLNALTVKALGMRRGEAMML